MNPDKFKGVQRLPKELEKALQDCYNREQQHIEPTVVCTYQTTLALLERGMLSAKTFINKKKAIFGFYVTQEGVDYLAHL